MGNDATNKRAAKRQRKRDRERIARSNARATGRGVILDGRLPTRVMRPIIPASADISPAERAHVREWRENHSDDHGVKTSVGDALRDVGLDPDTDAEIAAFKTAAKKSCSSA